MKDLTLEATELDSKVENETLCMCLSHTHVGFVGEEGKEQRNMKMQMYTQTDS